MRKFVAMVLTAVFAVTILSQPVSARRYDPDRPPPWAVNSLETLKGDEGGWIDPHAKLTHVGDWLTSSWRGHWGLAVYLIIVDSVPAHGTDTDHSEMDEPNDFESDTGSRTSSADG